MRVFEFREEELQDARRLVVDLDFIEMFTESDFEGKTLWSVNFPSGPILLTKTGFDRCLLAWKSK